MMYVKSKYGRVWHGARLKYSEYEAVCGLRLDWWRFTTDKYKAGTMCKNCRAIGEEMERLKVVEGKG